MRGFANAAVKNNTAAIADLTKAIELNPSNAGAYFVRGRVYYNMNNNVAAKADWTKSAALGDREAALVLKYPPSKHKPAAPGNSNWVVWKK